MKPEPPLLVLNGSRVGLHGGLRTFAENLIQCLGNTNRQVVAILPDAVPVPSSIAKAATPSYLASASGVSFLRPLAWLAYSYIGFPAPKDAYVLGLTHHVLPNRKHQIVTVHDLRPYFMPDHLPQKIYFRSMLPKALQRCDGVLTVSETSRQLLMEVYKLPEDRVRVVPNAVSLPLRVGPSRNESERQDREQDFLLMVGASWAHKNAEEVLRISHLWKDRFRLKIVAGEGKYRDHLICTVRDSGLASVVDFPVRLSREQLQQQYQRCTALIYPSKMEGFGLPPLEAMSYGKPAIVADIPVFRELYGEWPYFVALGNEESWATALNAVKTTEHERIAGGVCQAHSFTLNRMCSALHAAMDHFWG